MHHRGASLRFGVAIALMLAWASAAPIVRADPQRDPVAAEALFWQGRTAADAGDFETACRKFGESQRLDPSPGTLFNIAHCEEKLGRIASAWQHYLQVVGHMKAEDPRIAFARERVVDLEAKLPRLTVRLPETRPQGVRVLRGETELTGETLGVALPVDPGEHKIRTTAPGHSDREVSVVLAEAETKDIVVEIGAALPVPLPLAPPATTFDPGPVAPPPDAGMHPRRTVGWVVGGVGAAGLALSVVAGAMVLREKGIFEEGCPDDGKTDDGEIDCLKTASGQEGYDAAQRGARWGAVANVAFVTGAIAVAAGVVLVLTSPARARAKPTNAGRLGFTTAF